VSFLRNPADHSPITINPVSTKSGRYNRLQQVGDSYNPVPLALEA